MSNKYPGTPGTSMDQAVLEEAYKFINADTDDVEEQIVALQNPDEILNRGEICYEFTTSRIYPMIVKYLKDITERAHYAFEETDSDPNERLRLKWHITREIAAEIVGNIQGGADRYIEMLREMGNANNE